MQETPRILACHCAALRRAARQITQLYDGHLAASGLRATQYAVLTNIDQFGPIAITDLAARMGMDRTAMGRAVRPLQREGLIVIGPGRDGRSRALTLAPAGGARLRAAWPHWERAQAAFEAEYGAGEATTLRTALVRVIEAGAP